MDFLLALTELFSLGVTADALRANIGSKSAISLEREPVYPKFQVEADAPLPHKTFFFRSSFQKTRLNYLSYGIKIWTDLSSVLSQSTRLTNRRAGRKTDGQTELSSLDRVCIPCSAVKNLQPFYFSSNSVKNLTIFIIIISLRISVTTQLLYVSHIT